MPLTESVYLNKEALKTGMYTEVIDLITRTDNDIATEQIFAAIGKAKSYLSRFDLPLLFGVEATQTAPTFAAPELKKAVKDIAIFNIAGLSSVCSNYERIEARYVDSIKWLKDIQGGNSIPDGWPLRDMTDHTEVEGNLVSASYNEKKTNRI